jgi:Secretion system C-terminal sorting domain
MKYLMGFLLNFLCYFSSNAQSFTSANIDTLSNYIFNQQYTNITLPSYGAIKKSKGEDIFSGQHYFAIEPYFNHIACIGMLNSNHPDKCGFVMRWMNWYISHLDNYSQTLNYYYKPDGTGETTCPLGATGLYCNNIDAEDSDPALFWILANNFFLTTNNISFFTPTVKSILENAAQFVIDNLIQTDNLSIAKRSYPIKYTMDNSEVYKGFLALSNIEAIIYNDGAKATLYLSKANDIKLAIRTLLYNSTSELYDHYLGGATDTTQWYINGVTATLWPQLYGVDSINDLRSIHQRNVLNNNFNGTFNPDWTKLSFLGIVDDFTWASVGYVFSLANDTLHGYAQANYISNVFLSPFPYPPCYVADAGWCILSMAIKFPPNVGCTITNVTYDATQKPILYQNPTTSYLHIKMNNDNQFNEICVYNLLGEIVAKQKFNTTIDVSQLPPGVYFIRLMGIKASNSFSQKFIKK